MIPSRYRGIERTQKEVNAVLEQIRAEIVKWIKMDGGSVDYDKGLKRALCIIDKYTKGEQE